LDEIDENKVYTLPGKVVAPKNSWALITTLFDGGESRQSVAIGRFKGNLTLAIRTNGDAKSPQGQPQSRGHASWLVVESRFWQGIIDSIPQPRSVCTIVNHFMPHIALK
jgi:hypothetical protein